MSRLHLAIEQIVFARNYTIGLLDQTPATEWFRQPPGGVSHVAWQVGHLAFSEYRLALRRIRGPQPQDDALFSPEFVRLGGPNSVPDADPAKYLAPAEIRAVLDRVHEQVLRELPGLGEAELDQPVPHPHRFAKTKLLALLWCAHHEMLHAGQIGLLRRHLGYPPIW
jgi:DinB superfamily